MGFLHEDGLLEYVIDLSSEFIVLYLEVCDFFLIIFIVLKEKMNIGLDLADFVGFLTQNAILGV